MIEARHLSTCWWLSVSTILETTHKPVRDHKPCNQKRILSSHKQQRPGQLYPCCSHSLVFSFFILIISKAILIQPWVFNVNLRNICNRVVIYSTGSSDLLCKWDDGTISFFNGFFTYKLKFTLLWLSINIDNISEVVNVGLEQDTDEGHSEVEK